MARTKTAENAVDPATGRPLPQGVAYRGTAQYRARKLVDGARVTKTFESARNAREWLEETAVRVREGSYVDRRPLEGTTLDQLVQQFVAEEMKVGGRRRGAAEDLGHVPAIRNDGIAALSLAKLTPAAVRGFRDRQGQRFAPATVVKRLNLLALILNHATGEWDVPLMSNPASSRLVKRPRGADVKRDRRLKSAAELARETPPPANSPISDKPDLGEEDRLLAAVAKSTVPDDLFVVRLATAQALRQGEILGLRWEDVDFDRHLITIRGRHGRGTKTAGHQKTTTGKGKAGWEVRPLLPETAAILREKHADGDVAGPVAVVDVGNAAAFKVRIGRLIAKGELKDLRFHDLRHIATSRLAKRFPNPLDLKRITGHADLKSLDRYYQPDLSELATRDEAA